jgi:hypothetical protein
MVARKRRPDQRRYDRFVEEKPARAKAERPRDELGRPLPWGSETRIELEDYATLSLEENDRLGREHFNAGRYFPAHEAWEGAWRQARGTTDEELYKGLSQIAAGYTHHLRGNPSGAATLIRRGAGRIAAYPPGYRGLEVRRLVKEMLADADSLGAGRDLQPPSF